MSHQNEYLAFLPIIIPLAVIQLSLLVASLVHIFTHKTYRTGNRVLWVILCLFLSIFGPVLYFVIGRSDEGKNE